MSTAPSAKQDAAAAIRATDELFERFANAGDAAGIAARCYTEDAALLPPSAPPVHGRAAIAGFWNAFIAALSPQNVKLNTTNIEASGELAFGTGSYSFTSGGAPQSGKYLVVYRRQADGSYLCAADSFSPNA